MRELLFSALVLIIAMSATRASAAVTVIGDIADQTTRKDGGRVNMPTGRVGASKSGAPSAQGSRDAVFVFRLPAPGPDELPIVIDADFRFTIVTDLLSGDYDIDLYGLGARAAPTVLSGDHFAGEFDSTDAQLIRNDILSKPNPNRGLGIITTKASAPENGSDSLVDYLNTQYGPTGTGAGKYVFLRLNPDIEPPVEDSGIDVAFADNPTGKPEIVIAFVPEPNATCIAPAVAFWVYLYRRRTATATPCGISKFARIL